MLNATGYNLILQLIEKVMIIGCSSVAAIIAAHYSSYQYKLWFDNQTMAIERVKRRNWVREVPYPITIVLLLLFLISSFYVTIMTALVKEEYTVTSVENIQQTNISLLGGRITPMAFYTQSNTTNLCLNIISQQSSQTLGNNTQLTIIKPDLYMVQANNGVKGGLGDNQTYYAPDPTTMGQLWTSLGSPIPSNSTQDYDGGTLYKFNNLTGFGFSSILIGPFISSANLITNNSLVTVGSVLQSRGNVVDNPQGVQLSMSTATYAAYAGAINNNTMSYIDVFTYSVNNATNAQTYTTTDYSAEIIQSSLDSDNLYSMFLNNLSAAANGVGSATSFSKINDTTWTLSQWAMTNTPFPNLTEYVFSSMTIRWVNYNTMNLTVDTATTYGAIIDLIGSSSSRILTPPEIMDARDVYLIRYKSNFYEDLINLRPIFNGDTAIVTAVIYNYNQQYQLWRILLSLLIPLALSLAAYMYSRKDYIKVFTNSIYTTIENTTDQTETTCTSTVIKPCDWALVCVADQKHLSLSVRNAVIVTDSEPGAMRFAAERKPGVSKC
jgi:hypothetical protein